MRFVFPFIIIVALSSVGFFLWGLPEFEVKKTLNLTEFQRAQLVLEARKTNAQMLGGLALLVGFYFTWRNLRATEEGKITERFTRAVDQLSSEKIEQRAGGIFALERLAVDSRKDHASIIELLCTFLRHRERTEVESEPYKLPVGIPEDGTTKFVRYAYKASEWAPVAPEDVQAAAGVIRRDKHKLKAPHIVDLSGADLRRVVLEGSLLQGADLSNIHGQYLNLQKADLRDADLGQSNFKMANFDGVDLRGAWIGGAKFRWADLRKADLRGVKLVHIPEYDFGFESDPDLDGVIDDHITVDFENADLRDAILEGVSLERANLRFANLSTARGLTYSQIEVAFGNRKTQLPHGVARPPKWETEKE
ncbi:MAG: pentapeptide repeat-containing protein [Thermoanaerobaculia bacterium]